MNTPTTCPRCGGPGPFVVATWAPAGRWHHLAPGSGPQYTGCGATFREGEEIRARAPGPACYAPRPTAWGDRTGD